MRHHNHAVIGLTCWLTALLTLPVRAQPTTPSVLRQHQPTGTVKGQVHSRTARATLSGVNVSLDGTDRVSSTGRDGWFKLEGVPAGSYTIQFRMIGYRPMARTDVIVRPNRITFLYVELEPQPVELDSIVIVSGYFPDEATQPTSITGYSGEEIRRAPGSAGDVSRILATLPSVAKINDQSNSLIVRGGSPIENAFFVDNVEIPNVNHFPTQGTSGGAIGLLNVDFIQDVSFRTGGFSSSYGDRLSSVMDIRLREGNRNEFDGQLDLNFAGFGGVAEGPLFGDKVALLVAARRSYLDLIIKMADVGSTVAPRYGDYQGKLVYDWSPNHKLMLLGVMGYDHMQSDSTIAVENAMVVFGDQKLRMSTVGANWRGLWGSGVSNTSLSYTSSKYDEYFNETSSGQHLMTNRSSERTATLRNVNTLDCNSTNSVEFGIEAKHIHIEYDNFYAEYTDALGGATPAMILDTRTGETKVGAFVSYTVKPVSRLTATIGVRADYHSFSGNKHLSPRFSFSYRVGDRTTVTGSTGLYYQSLPPILLSQNQANRDLPDPRAVHYVMGLTHLFTDHTRLTLETYRKEYAQFPIDPQQPALFAIDELFYRYGFFLNHERLVAAGKARTTGMEATIQKRLARELYGLVSAAYFRSQYMGGDMVWRDRVFDNRLVLSLEGGYKPNSTWEFSARWIYAGGSPYTPFDLDQSTALNRAILNESEINEARYPDYHSLNVRADRRFHFRGSNLIVYASMWNAYNRKNVASYYWNEVENGPDIVYQWSALPILGLEYEF